MKARKVLVFLVIAAGGLWFHNTSMFFTSSADSRVSKLIAHRGVHQIYTGENRTSKTCRAESVKAINHPYIENTLSSMRAAFEYGADVVELDVHQTTDNVLVVFHDWTLDCQTNGQGDTHKQTVAYLKSLDIGYGFTDDGKTFPLRGTETETIPTLAEVFDAELAGQLLVNFKSNWERDGARFVEFMNEPQYRNDKFQIKLFGVYGGGEKPVRVTTTQLNGVKGFDRSALKTCLPSYLAIGWTGIVPSACKNRIIAIPMNYAPWLWGWPHKLTDRMKAAGTEVILWGPYDGSGFSSGVDDAETLANVPDNFDGYIWTNRIEVIGPLVKK